MHTVRTEEDARQAALLLEAHGLSHADIARHLRVHPRQVREWLYCWLCGDRGEFGGCDQCAMART